MRHSGGSESLGLNLVGMPEEDFVLSDQYVTNTADMKKPVFPRSPKFRNTGLNPLEHVCT